MSFQSDIQNLEPGGRGALAAQDPHNEPIQLADSGNSPAYRMGDVLYLKIPVEQGNIQFQPQDRFAFSPLPSDPISLEGLALLGLAYNFSRTSEGQKSLEHIILAYMNNITKMICAISEAGQTSWANGGLSIMLSAALMHKTGLLDDAGYLRTIEHARSVFDKMFENQAIGTALTGVSTLVKSTGEAIGAAEKGYGDILKNVAVTPPIPR